MKNILIIIFLLFAINTINADTLDINNYLDKIIKNNPITDQALLEENINLNKYLKSKGYFDPKLYLKNDNKFFDGKNYYNITKSGLEIPSWYGFSFYGNYSYTNGSYLNPENFLPDDGLFNAGLGLTLGKGLMIDERRMMLFQGRNFKEIGTWKKRKLLNDLLFNAKMIYFDWNYNYELTELLNEGIELALVKHNGTKEKFTSGDSPAIDTVETFIQLQKRRSEFLDSRNTLQKSELEIKNVIWVDEEQILVPPPYFENGNFSAIIDENVLASENVNNPKIQLIDLDIKNKEIETRFAKEQLKPELDLEYNVLNDPISPNPIISDFPVNYKWNLKFSMPLFLRKERGQLGINKAELNSMNFDLEIEKRNLQIKIEQLQNSLDILADQININEDVVKNFYDLLQAEIIKFNAGESSVLVVNLRENYYLNSKMKLLDLKRKYLISYSELEYLIGNLYQVAE